MDNRRGGRLLLAIAALAGAGAVLAGLGPHPAARKVETAPVRAVVAAAPVIKGSRAGPAPAEPVVTAGPAPAAAGSRPSTPPVPQPPVAPAGHPAYHRVGADVTGSPGPEPVRSATVEAANPLDGLDPLPAGWQATPHTVSVGGLDRTYLTVAPEDLSGPVPVVVLMHGVDMDAAGILNLTQLDAQVGRAIIVAPEGWMKSWDAGGCCGPAFRAGIDDVGFIRSAVARVLAANPAADPARVYAVGFSNGGRMAYRLACDLPGTFAGFVAAEAVPVRSCPSEHPLDIILIAQQADPLLTVDAGQPEKTVDGSAEPTVAATVARQHDLDGCSGAPAVTYDGVAEIKRWDCAAGTSLTYVWYPGGAHTWWAPSGATPGSTDLVLGLLGGQQLTDQAASPQPVS